MLTIGVDAHKQLHVAVALDDTGVIVDQWRGPNSTTGWTQLQQWAASHGPLRRWGIEGAWNYGRGLAQHLVATGETVYEINPRWTAQRRERTRQLGKNDQLDAYAVAQLVREQDSKLPRVTRDDLTSVLELLVIQREGLMAEATRLRNQIHQLLLALDPSYKQQLPALRTKHGLQALQTYSSNSTNPLDQQRVAAVQRIAARLQLVVAQAAELAVQIRTLAAPQYTPLTEICGVDLLTAGALAGILGPGKRFANEAQLAMHAGVAPLEVSSAGRIRHRVNRGGNRRLNAILYRMAVSQSRYSSAAKAYLERRVSEGKSLREARRALKRYLVRAIWRAWQQCQVAASATSGSEPQQMALLAQQADAAA